MDGDPSVEDRLDSFSLTFPLPYRVASIIVLGMITEVLLLELELGQNMANKDSCVQVSGDGP